jgi:2-amino-4-hydroxy-6-hydroxymethyldihydropteridine diphosphokinase
LDGRIIAAVALGSNVGDRASHLQYAIARLGRLLGDLRVSSVHETDPVPADPSSPRFLNAAALGATPLSARQLLKELQAIERERGRERPYPNAPRTLDLDLILYGDAVVDELALVVPHPRFRERRFVLEPLAEIAPGLRDPITGMTVGELLQRVQ